MVRAPAITIRSIVSMKRKDYILSVFQRFRFFLSTKQISLPKMPLLSVRLRPEKPVRTKAKKG